MEDGPTVLFDGVCRLCSGLVSFLQKADRPRKLRFLALQSAAGQALLERYHLPKDRFDSLVFVDNDCVVLKSSAVLSALRYLPVPYRWGRVLFIFPRPIRDLVYDFIARNRYRWFGRKKDSA